MEGAIRHFRKERNGDTGIGGGWALFECCEIGHEILQVLAASLKGRHERYWAPVSPELHVPAMGHDEAAGIGERLPQVAWPVNTSRDGEIWPRVDPLSTRQAMAAVAAMIEHEVPAPRHIACRSGLVGQTPQPGGI
jgi:hypothetical protein